MKNKSNEKVYQFFVEKLGSANSAKYPIDELFRENLIESRKQKEGFKACIRRTIIPYADNNGDFIIIPIKKSEKIFEYGIFRKGVVSEEVKEIVIQEKKSLERRKKNQIKRLDEAFLRKRISVETYHNCLQKCIY